MTKKIKFTLTFILFLLVSFIDVYAVIVQDKTLDMIFKPLLMTALVIVYLVSVKKPNFWLVSALFFSFWGDVFLLDKTNYFVFGLGSFLIAHSLYIVMTKQFLTKFNIKELLICFPPFAMIFLGVLQFIKHNLGEMLIPVIVYGLVISAFGAFTLLNYRQERTTQNMWLLLGAILFIASDSLIAINNFHSPKQLFNVSIIILYIVSQYLIVKAVIAKSSNN